MARLQLLRESASEALSFLPSPVYVGVLEGWSPDQSPLVNFPANPRGAPLPARATGALVPETPIGADLVLAFEEGDPERPIVLGVLSPPAVRLHLAEARPLDATVDGRRVLVEAEEEIVLRCGAASITLRRNGRVVVRGAYVETRAEGTNRIKGGSVRIN